MGFLKARLHPPFKPAFSTLRCILKTLPWLNGQITNQSKTYKTHCNADNIKLHNKWEREIRVCEHRKLRKLKPAEDKLLYCVRGHSKKYVTFVLRGSTKCYMIFINVLMLLEIKSHILEL